MSIELRNKSYRVSHKMVVNRKGMQKYKIQAEFLIKDHN